MSKVVFLLIVIVMFMSCADIGAAQSSLLDKAISEYKQENYEESLELFLKIKGEGTLSAQTAYYLGSIYKNIGNHREAVKYLKEAISLDPTMRAAYAELIEAFYNLDEFKEAEDYIAEAEKRGLAAAEITFLKGTIYMAKGKADAAIREFRLAAQQDKSYEQPADLYIAVVYAHQKKYKESLNMLKAVASAGAPSELAEFAKDYEKHITRLLQEHRDWKFSAAVRYQYDDNVVLKPSTLIPDFIITGEKDSSIVANFKVDYTPLIADPWLFSSHLYLFDNSYFKNKEYVYRGVSVSAVPGYNFGPGVITMPLSYSHVWLHGSEYMGILSLNPTMSILLGNGHIGQIGVGYAKRSMLRQPFNDDEDRDGSLYSASAGYYYVFSENKGILGAKYEFVKDSADGSNWDSNGNKITLSAIIPLAKGLDVSLSADAFIQDYKNIHTFFDVRRKDKTYSASCNFLFEIYKNVNLNVQYRHTRAESNIAVYDYRRNVYSFGIEYKF